MAGIYIHIPFCRKACHYCNFHFSTSMKNIDEMVDSMILELKQKKVLLSLQTVNTIYFGGGTPSLLTETAINSLLNCVFNNYNCSELLEITLEANPEDFNLYKFTQFKKSGVNRLSIGVQSFHNSELLQLNRVHDAQQSLNAISIAREAQFDNISIDLMFGLPGSDTLSWKKTLNQTIKLNIEHISCYNLTLEEKTALWYLANNNTIKMPNEIDQELQYRHTHNLLSQSGYDHYEISNYAKSGFLSEHNSNYWNKVAYLGIGPSAHSYINNKRSWNLSNNSLYIKGIQEGINIQESEVLSDMDHYNEYIMLSLRRKTGVLKSELNKHSAYSRLDIKQSFTDMVNSGNLNEDNYSFFLSPELFYISDNISSQLFATKD